MTPVAAGIDVGNSTTEVVLGRSTGPDGRDVAVVAAGRAPTRGSKGSPQSLAGAVALVRRLERRHGLRVVTAALAPLRPVTTATVTIPEQAADTGRLWLAALGAGTAGGSGAGAGRPHRVGSATGSDIGGDVGGDEPLVAVVPAGTGYLLAVDLLRPLAETGRLAAVVLADDEAVLVANRLPSRIPVVDEVDVDAALRADRLVVEVAGGGGLLRTLPDPLRLAALAGLGESEVEHAALLAPLVADASSAVVAVGGRPAVGDRAATGGWLDLRGTGRLPLREALDRARAGAVGLVTGCALPPDFTAYAVDDLWPLDLADVATQVAARRSGTAGRPVAVAALRADAPYADRSGVLAGLLGVPVSARRTETEASRAGALSTPGATPDTVVVDLGGGTIDAVHGDRACVAAGGGELLTAAVAALTGVTAAAAEHVKRGPAHRVEAPQVLLAEDGTRAFLDRPAPRETVGMLVVTGPAGLLPFHRALAPGEWRGLRRRLKVDLVGANVARALRTLDVVPGTVVVVGGPAGDDEILAAVGGALPAGTAVARGEVAGQLGHRHAVAYGLLLAALDR